MDEKSRPEVGTEATPLLQQTDVVQYLYCGVLPTHPFFGQPPMLGTYVRCEAVDLAQFLE